MKLSKLYIDPELQFPFIISFMVLAMGEGLFIGWGFYEMRQWERQGGVFEFLGIMLLATLLLVAFNFLVGALLSRRVAEPLKDMRNAMQEIARGNLEAAAPAEDDSLLRSHIAQFNDMAERLRHLIYRDHKYCQEINEILTRCQSQLEGESGLSGPARKEMQKLIKEAKSELSVIHSFFMVGKQENHE